MSIQVTFYSSCPFVTPTKPKRMKMPPQEQYCLCLISLTPGAVLPCSGSTSRRLVFEASSQTRILSYISSTTFHALWLGSLHRPCFLSTSRAYSNALSRSHSSSTTTSRVEWDSSRRSGGNADELNRTPAPPAEIARRVGSRPHFAHEPGRGFAVRITGSRPPLPNAAHPLRSGPTCMAIAIAEIVRPRGICIKCNGAEKKREYDTRPRRIVWLLRVCVREVFFSPPRDAGVRASTSPHLRLSSERDTTIMRRL